MTANEIKSFKYSYTLGEVTSDRYDRMLHGLLIDTGAAGRSKVGIGQFKALQRLHGDLKLDKIKAGIAKISGIDSGVLASIGAVILTAPIGQISFHFVPSNISFLLGLSDMKRLGATLDVINNKMIKSEKHVAQLFEKYGHLWITLGCCSIFDLFTEMRPKFADPV